MRNYRYDKIGIFLDVRFLFRLFQERGMGSEVFILDKVGILPVKINIFKNQKNRDDSTIHLKRFKGKSHFF